MKGVTVLLFLFVLPTLVSFAQIPNEFEGKLKGNVKQVRLCWGTHQTYIYDYCNRLLTSETLFRDSFCQSVHHYIYDNAGNIAEWDSYHRSWPLNDISADFNKTIYSYEAGKLVKQESSNENKTYRISTYRYDTLGRKIEEICGYVKQTTRDVTTFNYTGHNKYPSAELHWVEERTTGRHASKRTYDGKRIVVYDTTGRLIEEQLDFLPGLFRESTIWKSDGCIDTTGNPPTVRVTYKYDNNGELIEKIGYDSTNSFISKETCQYEDYDEHGNWQSKKEYRTLKASSCGTRMISQTTRKIEYY